MIQVDGRGDSPAANQTALASLYERVGREKESAVWVWRPHRQVAFGPRDIRHDGYDTAVTEVKDQGFEVVERTVGGHPVAHTGDTLVFLRAIPIEDPRQGLHERYATMVGLIRAALTGIGVEVELGEPPASFCPGEHSLSADGKVVGIAQRVTARYAVTSGVVIIDRPTAVAKVLEPVYTALELPFDPDTVGSIATAGGPADSTIVAKAITDALLDGHTPTAISAKDLIEPSDVT